MPTTNDGVPAPTTPGAGTLTLERIMGFAQAAGFTEHHIAEAGAVAMAESGGRTGVVNSLKCVGLWQINQPVWGKQYGTIEELKDPARNAKAAYGISKGGTNWHPWSAYGNDAYKSALKEAEKLLPKLAGVAAGPITGPAVEAGLSAVTGGGGITGAIDQFTETLRKSALSWIVVLVAVVLIVLGIVILLRRQAVGVGVAAATGGSSVVVKSVLKGVAKS